MNTHHLTGTRLRSATLPRMSRPKTPNVPGFLTSLSVLFVLLYAAMTGLRAWGLMLILGILHLEAGIGTRGTGFWPCVAIALILQLAIFRASASSSSSK